MRIAILPLFGMSRFTSDSNYRVYADIIKFTEKCGIKDVHFYYMVPSQKNKEEKDKVEFEKLPNTTFVEVDMELNDFYSEMAKIPEEMYRLFSRKAGKYPIDAIFTSRTIAAGNINSVCIYSTHYVELQM